MAFSLSYSKSILVLAFISDKIRRGETEYISTKVMSEALNIPKPTLSVIFNNLIRAGIIESKEGIHGGVRITGEEKMLNDELEGNTEYKKRVRYRLIPSIW